MHRFAILLSAFLPALASPQGTSPAAAYPSKVIRFVTGSSPGGGADLTTRAIQQRLVSALGVQVIVDNRPGVAGMLANDYTAKAAADGYTILLQPGSFVVVSSLLNPKQAWDPLKHLAPVIQVSSYDFVLVAHPSVPATSARQLVAVARSKPGAISFASTGVGSNFHLAGELFKLRSKADMLHVAYRGSPPAIIDLISGRVDTMFIHVVSVQEYIRNGRLRPLAVTGTKRNPLLPNVATIDESALKGYEIIGYEGVFAPAGTPRDIITKLNQTIGAALSTTEMKEAWTAKAVEFIPNTPEQFTAKLRDDYNKTAALIKAADIKPER